MFHAGVSGFAFFAVGVVSDATLFCISTAFDPQFGPQYNKGYRGNVLEMFETVEILDPLESGKVGQVSVFHVRQPTAVQHKAS